MATGLEAVVLAADPAAAEAAWRAWRGPVVLDDLGWADAQLLPVLPQAQLEGWLAGDPAAGRLLGLVRRAWSEAQLHLHQLRAVVAHLEAAGAGPVMIAGPAALHLRNAREGSVRPIPDSQVLVRRERLPAAAEALRQAGWTPMSPPPPPRAMSWVDQWVWQQAGMTLRLLWRAAPVVPWRTSRYEAELWARAEPVLPAAQLMLSRLAEGGGWHGPMRWPVDAALLTLTDVEWAECARLARRYAPTALPRLAALRGEGAAGRLPRLGRAERSLHRALVQMRARVLGTLRPGLA